MLSGRRRIMSERRDNTTEHLERDAPPEPERRPQNYYYDDGTNYEVYDPLKDRDDDEESEKREAELNGK
jgi:hypothetical protein